MLCTSELAAGVCATTGLTDRGYATALLAQKELPLHSQGILVVSLFGGIEGCCRAIEILDAPLCGFVSLGSNGNCHKVVRARYPDTTSLFEVEKVTLKVVKQWAVSFPRCVLALVAGDAPCQGVCGLNSLGADLSDPRSALMQNS